MQKRFTALIEFNRFKFYFYKALTAQKFIYMFKENWYITNITKT